MAVGVGDSTGVDEVGVAVSTGVEEVAVGDSTGVDEVGVAVSTGVSEVVVGVSTGVDDVGVGDSTGVSEVGVGVSNGVGVKLGVGSSPTTVRLVPVDGILVRRLSPLDTRAVHSIAVCPACRPLALKVKAAPPVVAWDSADLRHDPQARPRRGHPPRALIRRRAPRARLLYSAGWTGGSFVTWAAWPASSGPTGRARPRSLSFRFGSGSSRSA